MGRREKSARPLALGATYENISTSMTGTKCITRAHKGFQRAHSRCQKCSKGPNWARLCLLSEDNSTAHDQLRSTRRLKIPAKTTTDPSLLQHFCSIRNENFSVLVGFQVVFGVKNTLLFERSTRVFPSIRSSKTHRA